MLDLSPVATPETSPGPGAGGVERGRRHATRRVGPARIRRLDQVDQPALWVEGEAAPRSCAWCEGPIPAGARRDSVTCSKRCRQARNRFTHGARATAEPGRQATAEPTADTTAGSARDSKHILERRHLRLAYADPPYPGKAFLYRGHPDYAGEVDHRELIERLLTFDGWALSTSAAALPAVLQLCPPWVRVAAWVRGGRPNRSRDPINAWEPVVYWPARRIEASPGSPRRVDVLTHGVTPMTTLPGRVIGAKPAVFSRWLFEDLLAARPGDELADLFPGSGAVGRAWQVWSEASSSTSPS